MVKFWLLIALLFFISCEKMNSTWNWGVRPRPLTGVRGFPDATSDYGRGFKAGCETGFGAVTKGALAEIKTRFDAVQMSRNNDYANGWWDGFEQCTYINDWDVL